MTDLLDIFREQEALADAHTVQRETLDVISTELGADAEFDLFVAACESDGLKHGGFVAQNRVREALSNEHGLTVNPRRYSTFWRRAQLAGHITPAVSTEPNTDVRGRNLGKRSNVHRWLSASP